MLGLFVPIVPVITVETLTNYHTYCPTQWEGTTTTGERVYIRYRHGHLTINIGNECVFATGYGSNDGGVMSFDDLQSVVPAWMILPNNDYGATP